MENTNVSVISAKNLNLWYGDFKALKHISTNSCVWHWVISTSHSS